VKLENITSEGDLREWLTDHISACEGRLGLEWIEPSLYGSSVGSPDCKIHSDGKTVGLELKYLLTTKKGIKWSLRPAQRRYHHMFAKQEGKSAILAYIGAKEHLVLVRGDNVPLRDYAKDPASGCAHGLCKMEIMNFMSINPDHEAMFEVERYLFNNSDFWRKNNV
jgi:hypothetical protein